jgi:FAD/FMN-containing dehydrogenase
LRKDNTGYDLKQLFIGAEGTLGIVTAAVLKLFPRPSEAQSAWVAVATPDDAVALLGLMREELGESVSSFELVSRPTVDLLLAGVPGSSDPMTASHPWYVLTEVTGQGAPGSLAEPLSRVLGLAVEKELVRDAVLATSGEQARKLWKMREDLPFGVQAAGGAVPHDVSVPLSRITEFIRRADDAMRAAYPTSRFCCFGHVGDGNLHYNPVRPADWTFDQWNDEREAINKIVHDIVVDLGGSISAEHGIGLVRLEENLRYKSPVEIQLMERIKRALDPSNIMNPGKVVPM